MLNKDPSITCDKKYLLFPDCTGLGNVLVKSRHLTVEVHQECINLRGILGNDLSVGRVHGRKGFIHY